MTITKVRQRIGASLAVIALSILSAPGMRAQCSAHVRNAGALAPEVRSLQEPADLDQEGSSEQAGSSEALDQEKNDSSDVTVLGMWKNIYFSGGVANDVGFRQFNAGGTELLNDTGIPGTGNNFCVGAWKRVGARRYELVHTFFVFDGTKPIAIAIEQSNITVSRDGNRFRGNWTQDNYDFSGNIVPGFHSQGRVTGERFAPGQFPFPFPF